MSGIKLLVALVVAMPSIALAQVGPNPAAVNGSLSPNVGSSTDAATAPQDVKVGTEPTISRTVERSNEDNSSVSNGSDAATGTQVGEGNSDTKTTPGAKPKSSHKPR